MIAITLFTCDRPIARRDYAWRCLRSLHRLSAGGEDLWLHIADDGSSVGHRAELKSLGEELFPGHVSVSNSGAHGYGANYNAATQVVHGIADVVLPL